MKRKKVLLALACAASIAASMVPVNAVNAAGKASHICVWVVDKETRLSVASPDGHTHSAEFEVRSVCQDRCGSGYRYSKITRRESHEWGSGTDRGHKGDDMHAFDIKCGAYGWIQYIEIICNYNRTGRHDTPW